MARQLNMLSAGQVITTALHTEMQQSYLEYAMSVIVGTQTRTSTHPVRHA
jgi:DNA gyrase subunit A